METISSWRIFTIVLTVLFIALHSNLLAHAEDTIPKHKSIRGDLAFGTKSITKIQGKTSVNSLNLERASFPHDFMFGAGSSAMQIEGAIHEGGRGPSIYDAIEHDKGFADIDKYSTMIHHYQRYKEDVQHLKKLGVNSYRMSISWSRILPDGTLKGGINQEGIDFYNNLIDELIANGITPFVTILHFDYPLALYQNLGGFLNRTILKHFKDYSELLFKTYGDRVKHWTTINEGEVTAIFTYMHNMDNGINGRIPDPCQNTRNCTQAYIILHNFLLAHATSARLYKKKFQRKQGGEIGLVLSSHIFVPYTSKAEDVAGAQRLMDFYIGWVLDPLFYGDYPKVMKDLVGNRLPNFTEKEKKMIKGSSDFIGLNYYTSFFARNEPNKTNIKMGENYDSLASTEVINAEGKCLGYKDTYGPTYVYPKGLYDLLLYVKEKYQNPKIYITENGIPSYNIPNPLDDKHRIAYIQAHLNATKEAINNGVNVRGYFVWTAFDTFEFQAGYQGHWGLYHVDFNDNFKRVPKASADWYRKFLTSHHQHFSTQGKEDKNT